jgi:peroxiredoxin
MIGPPQGRLISQQRLGYSVGAPQPSSPSTKDGTMKNCCIRHALLAGLICLSVPAVAQCQPEPLVGKPGPDLVEEMIELLNKTDSTDTFFITLKLLEGMKQDAKMVIPAIMRNAERLGIFKSHLEDKDDSTVVESVLLSLQRIRTEKGAATPSSIRPIDARMTTADSGEKDPSSVDETRVAPVEPLLRKQAPKTSACPLRVTEGQRELKLLINCTTSVKEPGEFETTSLATEVRRQLQKRFEGNNVKVSFVPVALVETARTELKKKNEKVDGGSLAQHFKADYVLNLTVRSLPVDETSVGFFSAEMYLSLSVLDGRVPQDDPIFEEEMKDSYPKYCPVTRGQNLGGSDDARLFTRAANVRLAGEITKRFSIEAEPIRMSPAHVPEQVLSPVPAPLVTAPGCVMRKARQVDDFSLSDLDGKVWRLRRQRHGELVLLNFWHTQCPPCIRQIAHLNELHDAYKARGLEVIGVACETGSPEERVKRVSSICSKHDIRYQLLMSGDRGPLNPCPLCIGLEVACYPSFKLLDRDGKVIWESVGLNDEQRQELDRQLQQCLPSRP